MRKRSRYRPRNDPRSPLEIVQTNLCLLKGIQGNPLMNIHARNYAALDALATGQATTELVQVLGNAAVMALSICECLKIGTEHEPVLREAWAAVQEVVKRERHVCRGPELVAVKEMMAVHDAQLDVIRVGDLDKAMTWAKARYER